MKRLILLGLLILACLPLLPFVTAALTPVPQASLDICFYAINPQSQTAQVSFDLKMASANATGRVLIGEIDSQGQGLVLHLISNGQQYENQTDVITWQLGGRPQDYPFDSYSVQVSVSDDSISFSNGTTGAYANLNTITAHFCGSNAQALASTWNFGVGGSTVQSSGPKPLHTVGIVTATKNEQWGLLIMLPIWIALAFVGAMFALEASRISDRLTILMALFVFAPVYLFTILGQSPPSPTYNLPVAQTTFLIIAILLGGLATLASSSTFSLNRQLLIDGLAIIISEIAYIGLTYGNFLLTSSPAVSDFYQIGISVYFTAAVVPLAWKAATVARVPQRTMFARILVFYIPSYAGTILTAIGAFLSALVPEIGIYWLFLGLVTLFGFYFIRRISKIKRLLEGGADYERYGIL